jgi:signal transduction histidine kinase
MRLSGSESALELAPAHGVGRSRDQSPLTYDVPTASLIAGLVNMRDRIQTVGGMMEITPRRGRGTSVRGSVPIVA